MKALWNGKIIAESNNTIVIEGNQYFPPESINREFFSDSDFHTACPWKGLASYYKIDVDGIVNEDAAWYYLQPKPLAEDVVGKNFTNYVAFWRDVQVVE